jgi:type I restriction enzyme M protein
MPRARSSAKNTNSTANLGFEAKLWLAADKLRSRTGQDKPLRGVSRFGLVNRARRVRLRGKQPQQSNSTTRRLAVMNLALPGIEADFGPEHADTFRRDLHPDLRADYVLANPPFNDSDTAPRGSALLQNRTNPQVVRRAQDNFRTAMREAQNPKRGRPTCRVWEDKDDDVRWQWKEATWTTDGSPKGEHNPAHQYLSPQRGNANFAWVQHFIRHLAPHGMAGFVLVRFWM